MAEPSDRLLRTFGALPVSTRVLDLGCGRGDHTEPLIRLGFDVYACDTSPEAVASLRRRLEDHLGANETEKRVGVARPDALGFPDAFFDWVVAFETLSRLETRHDMLETLEEVRRVMKPGGWLYLGVPAVPDLTVAATDRGYAGDSGLSPTFTPRTLDELMRDADFVVAESPSVAAVGGRRMVQGIYRKVDSQTPI